MIKSTTLKDKMSDTLIVPENLSVQSGESRSKSPYKVSIT